jgi:hypothetical protein
MDRTSLYHKVNVMTKIFVIYRPAARNPTNMSSLRQNQRTATVRPPFQADRSTFNFTINYSRKIRYFGYST